MMNINQIDNKVFLITGGTGSWGQELTAQLLQRYSPKQVIIFSRGEINQVGMQRKFNDPRLKFVIGDTRDFNAINNACKGVDFVFHLAALKHVPICEYQPEEAIKTNINGTINTIEASINAGVQKFILVSTDKAVDPINLYGMTKGIAERLVIQANCKTNTTEFICVRAGNVIGTNGSLIPYVINEIKTNNRVQVTNPEMTRFFLTLPKAISLLFTALENGVGGETYVLRMPSFILKDIIQTLVDYYGNKDTQVIIIGTREGEKIHEVLISDIEVSRTTIVNSQLLAINPELITGRQYFHFWNSFDFASNERLIRKVSSEDNVQDVRHLKELLMEGGFLK